MTHTYLIHYGELGLKGRNRSYFERQLARNIRRALGDMGKIRVRRFYSYFIVRVQGDAPAGEVEARLRRVFGIAYFAPVTVVERDIDTIGETAVKLAEGVITPETTFRIRTSRGDKTYPLISPEVDRRVGSLVVDATGAPVDLSNPDVTLSIQIYEDAAYLFVRRIPGAGGLPVNSSGRVLALFSGGIDSPVAAHMLMKRGCAVDFLHLHLLHGREEVREAKVVALARAVLAPHRYPARLYMASAAPFEAAMALEDSRVATVVFRRFIMRLAERVAYRREIPALVTGESVGQVASQTLQNIKLISQATALPILRPLIGMDKLEIIALAQEIDTYNISIQPYQDPCSLHARNPATHAQLEEVQHVEAAINVAALVEETLTDHTQVVRIRFNDS